MIKPSESPCTATLGSIASVFMAPKAKSAAVGTAKAQRTKKAGGLLASQIHADTLTVQRKQLKVALKNLSKEKKAAQRVAKKLKAKANKTALGDLMQIIVMKASQVSQENQEAEEGGSSSSADAWVPTSPKDAFEKIAELMPEHQQQEMEKFAAALRAKAAAAAQ